MNNLIFPLFSLMFNFFQSCSIFLVQESVSKEKAGRINLINKYVARSNTKLTQIFYGSSL